MMPLAYWVHDLSPFLIQFSDTFGIRYYGLAYVLGFFGAIWLLHRYARAGRSQVPAAKVGDLMVAIVIGVLVGGRLGHFIFYQPWLLWQEPLAVLRVWDGGMASHGGFIGVAVALMWFARAEKVPFLHLGDLVTSATPVGLLLGRIANFINGELWGKPTDVPWAVVFAQTADRLPRHPSQLYQAALEGAVLLAYAQWRFWRSPIVRTHPGQLAGEFLIAYALLRTIGEIYREPDASLILGVSRGTFYSFFLIIAGIAVIFFARSRPAKIELPRG
jgi:phosphatidylglycerol---prolipoprotein diacylglyceryl transferase